MKGFGYLLKNFFTHKDFIAEDVRAGLVPGTLFTPLHFIFSAIIFLAKWIYLFAYLAMQYLLYLAMY